MRVVLDTSALFYPAALQRIDPAVPVIVPAVVFLERARQLARDRRMSPSEYAALLETGGWAVEPFGGEEALRSRAFGLTERQWRRLARDAMIAGHVREADRLWTANPRDFRDLGIAAEQLVDVHAMPGPA